VTLYFSRTTPNLLTVIPAMDHIDTVFTDACQPTSNFCPAVEAVIEIAKQTLNCYYSLTDASELYRIAMGLLFCESLLSPSAHFCCQCFTLVTNLPTSKLPVEHLNGLTLHKPLFAPNSISHMPHDN